MIYFKIKLQLKFRKNKYFHEKRMAHWYNAILLLLESPKQHLIDVTSFRLLKLFYSRSIQLHQ